MYHVAGTHIVPGMSPEQQRKAQRLERPATVAALLVIPYLLLTYYLGTEPGWEVVTDVLYLLLWGFFVAEALIMLRLSPSNREWFKRNVLDVVIIVLTAPVALFASDSFEALQCLWVLRILDLLPDIHRWWFRITVLRFAFIL